MQLTWRKFSFSVNFLFSFSFSVHLLVVRSYNVCTLFRRHLHNEISEQQTLAETFVFIDPGSTYHLNANFEKYIVERLKEGNPDRLFFWPHNQK